MVRHEKEREMLKQRTQSQRKAQQMIMIKRKTITTPKKAAIAIAIKYNKTCPTINGKILPHSLLATRNNSEGNKKLLLLMKKEAIREQSFVEMITLSIKTN